MFFKLFRVLARVAGSALIAGSILCGAAIVASGRDNIPMMLFALGFFAAIAAGGFFLIRAGRHKRRAPAAPPPATPVFSAADAAAERAAEAADAAAWDRKFAEATKAVPPQPTMPQDVPAAPTVPRRGLLHKIEERRHADPPPPHTNQADIAQEILDEILAEAPKTKGPDTHHLVYRSAAGTISDRDINISRLVAKDGVLYIYAYCYLKGAARSFRVDRIIDLSQNGRPIPDPAKYLIDTYRNRDP